MYTELHGDGRFVQHKSWFTAPGKWRLFVAGPSISNALNADIMQLFREYGDVKLICRPESRRACVYVEYATAEGFLKAISTHQKSPLLLEGVPLDKVEPAHIYREEGPDLALLSNLTPPGLGPIPSTPPSRPRERRNSIGGSSSRRQGGQSNGRIDNFNLSGAWGATDLSAPFAFTDANLMSQQPTEDGSLAAAAAAMFSGNLGGSPTSHSAGFAGSTPSRQTPGPAGLSLSGPNAQPVSPTSQLYLTPSRTIQGGFGSPAALSANSGYTSASSSLQFTPGPTGQSSPNSLASSPQVQVQALQRMAMAQQQLAFQQQLQLAQQFSAPAALQQLQQLQQLQNLQNQQMQMQILLLQTAQQAEQQRMAQQQQQQQLGMNPNLANGLNNGGMNVVGMVGVVGSNANNNSNVLTSNDALSGNPNNGVGGVHVVGSLNGVTQQHTQHPHAVNPTGMRGVSPFMGSNGGMPQASSFPFGNATFLQPNSPSGLVFGDSSNSLFGQTTEILSEDAARDGGEAPAAPRPSPWHEPLLGVNPNGLGDGLNGLGMLGSSIGASMGAMMMPMISPRTPDMQNIISLLGEVPSQEIAPWPLADAVVETQQLQEVAS